MFFKRKKSVQADPVTELRENIIDVLCSSADLTRYEVITGYENFKNDFAMDSMDIAEFQYSLENKFGISLDYESGVRPEFSTYNTLNEVIMAVADEKKIPRDAIHIHSPEYYELRKDIYGIICEAKDLKPKAIVTGKELLTDDLGYDSLDTVELQTIIESHISSKYNKPYFMFDDTERGVVNAFDYYAGTPNKIVAVAAKALNIK